VKPAFEQTSYARTVSKTAKITQELRRARPAPRLSPGRRRPATGQSIGDEQARQRLEKRITAHLPSGRLALAVTDNRHTMISVRRDKGPLYRVRLHHMFLEAPPTVTRALARYVAHNDGHASRELGSFIDTNQEAIRRAVRRQPAPPTVETFGEVFNLQEVFDDLNRRYFASGIDARITWGTRANKRRRRTSIKMGSYSVEDRLIRIHPALDRRFVPRYFLEWIVYHEMLHQVHDIPVVDGRRQFHTPEFLDQERMFEHYERARLWERQNLDRILNF
jgi:hypothetical protein